MPHAHSIQVELQFEPAAVQLWVCDDGQGFEVPSYLNLNDLTRTGHFGLIGMRERAQLVNGQLKIESSKGKGTTVTLSIAKT